MQVTGVQAIREAQILDLAEPTSYTGVYGLLTATVINDHELNVPDELRGSKPRGFPSITQTEAELGLGPGASKSGAWVPSVSPSGVSQGSDRFGVEPQLYYLLPDLRQVLYLCLLTCGMGVKTVPVLELLRTGNRI